MECNKEEALRAMDIAKRKVTENDYEGAKKFVEKAQNLYPKLDGLKQVSMMIDVYITAGNKIFGGESDWYGILGVDPLADEEVVKKQYKKLALLLHPDKNKCKGAEEAFKLVSEAWCLLSDKVKRIAYDQKRKLKDVKPRKSRKPKQPPNQSPSQPPNQPNQPANHRRQPNQRKQPQPNQRKQQPPNQPKQPPNQQQEPPSQPKQSSNQQQEPPSQPKQSPNQQQKPPPNQQKQQPPSQQKPPPNQQKQQPPSQHKPPPSQHKQQSPNKQKQPPNQPSSSGVRNGKPRSNKVTSKVGTFWTMCNKCKTEYEYVRVFYFNKTLRCRNCHQNFIATETEKAKSPEATNKNQNGASSSCCERDPSLTVSIDSTSRMVDSDCANQAEDRAKRAVEGSQDAAAKGVADSDYKVEERVFKKLKTEVSGGIKV